MHVVRPNNKILLQQRQGCTEVGGLLAAFRSACSYGTTGPGKKHLRTIELADWQEVIDISPSLHPRGLPEVNLGVLTGGDGDRDTGMRHRGDRSSMAVQGHPAALRSDAGPAWGGVAVLEDRTVSVATRRGGAAGQRFVQPTSCKRAAALPLREVMGG